MTREVGHTYEVNVQLGGGAVMAIRGSFELNADTATMNGEIDKIWPVIERLQARASIEVFEAELARKLAEKKRNLEMYAQHEQLMPTETPAQREVRDKNLSTIKKIDADFDADIAEGEKKLAEVRAKAK